MSCSSLLPTVRRPPFVVFADGFAGAVKEPGRAAFRPSGLAVAPDGALFVSDDVHGRIWRITFVGGPDIKGVEAAPVVSADVWVRPPRRRLEGFTRTPATPPCRRRPARLRKRLCLAGASSAAKPRSAPGAAAMGLTARARRWEPTSPAANGYGATAALRPSRKPSPTACQSRGRTRGRCRRLAALKTFAGRSEAVAAMILELSRSKSN